MLTVNIKEKSFGTNEVLKDVVFEITEPGIYGVIGKNGQGKTTMFKCILGIERYKGDCMLRDKKVTLREVGWCDAEPAVYDELTAEEFYTFYGHLVKQRVVIDKILFELPKNRLIKEFSTGMKKKVYLNAVLQKAYPLYILDEPFNGLDIESNYYLMRYLVSLSEHSIVIISSHMIDTLYKYCKTIFMLKDKSIKHYDKEEFSQIEEEFFK